jgi:uncharacterized protein (DUF58 family)
VVGAVLGALLISLLTSTSNSSIVSLFLVLLAGAVLYRRFRNRGQREVQRFVRRASAVKEVRLVTFHNGQFTVITQASTAKTYVKLNALLAAGNERLYHGDPMTLVVRDDLPDEEVRRLLATPGVRYVREDKRRPPRLAAPGGRP